MWHAYAEPIYYIFRYGVLLMKFHWYMLAKSRKSTDMSERGRSGHRFSVTSNNRIDVLTGFCSQYFLGMAVNVHNVDTSQ